MTLWHADPTEQDGAAAGSVRCNGPQPDAAAKPSASSIHRLFHAISLSGPRLVLCGAWHHRRLPARHADDDLPDHCCLVLCPLVAGARGLAAVSSRLWQDTDRLARARRYIEAGQDSCLLDDCREL